MERDISHAKIDDVRATLGEIGSALEGIADHLDGLGLMPKVRERLDALARECAVSQSLLREASHELALDALHASQRETFGIMRAVLAVSATSETAKPDNA